MQSLSSCYEAEVKDLTSKLPIEPQSNITDYFLRLQRVDLPKFNLDHMVALSLNESLNSKGSYVKQYLNMRLFQIKLHLLPESASFFNKIKKKKKGI